VVFIFLDVKDTHVLTSEEESCFSYCRKETLGRPRRRWVDNIKMDLGEIGWDGRDWIELSQDRDQWRALVNTVMNLRVP
jgi:hypothetical protein